MIKFLPSKISADWLVFYSVTVFLPCLAEIVLTLMSYTWAASFVFRICLLDCIQNILVSIKEHMCNTHLWCLRIPGPCYDDGIFFKPGFKLRVSWFWQFCPFPFKTHTLVGTTFKIMFPFKLYAFWIFDFSPVCWCYIWCLYDKEGGSKKLKLLALKGGCV